MRPPSTCSLLTFGRLSCQPLSWQLQRLFQQRKRPRRLGQSTRTRTKPVQRSGPCLARNVPSSLHKPPCSAAPTASFEASPKTSVPFATSFQLPGLVHNNSGVTNTVVLESSHTWLGILSQSSDLDEAFIRHFPIVKAMAVLGFFASSFHYPNLFLLALLFGSSQESKIALTQRKYIPSTVWGVSRDKCLQEKRELWHKQILHSTIDNSAYLAFIVMASLTISVP